MAKPGSLVTGVQTTNSAPTSQILVVEDGIFYLNQQDNGIKWVKQLLSNRGDKVAQSFQFNWDETSIPIRRETVTIADGATTSITVANSAAYTPGDILKSGNELMRMTAIVNATGITVVRGYGGTTAAAHTAQLMFNLGVVAAENSTGPTSLTVGTTRLYNYVSQVEWAVELSDVEQATMQSLGSNPAGKQLEIATLAFWKRFAQLIMYGVRYNDTTLNQRVLGGVDFFLTTNVTNLAGPLTIDAVDAEILKIVNAGGNPDYIVCSPVIKQKLDKLDANKLMVGKKEHTGGNLFSTTWQSGLLDHELNVIVDFTLDDSTLYIFDSSTQAIIPLVHNGVDGRLSLVDATLPGQSGRKTLLRAYYTFQLDREEANSKIYGIT